MTITLKRIFISSISLWLACAIFGAYFLLNLPRFINFGIDLVGGTYITLNVQVEKAYEQELYEKVQSMRSRLEKEKLALPVKQTVSGTALELGFETPDLAKKAESVIQSLVEPGSLSISGATVRYSLSAKTQKEIAR
jgi:preprotein translocase subunit SecD